MAVVQAIRTGMGPRICGSRMRIFQATTTSQRRPKNSPQRIPVKWPVSIRRLRQPDGRFTVQFVDRASRIRLYLGKADIGTPCGFKREDGKSRRGPAAVTGDDPCTSHFSVGAEWEGAGIRMIREPEDLPVSV